MSWRFVHNSYDTRAAVDSSSVFNAKVVDSNDFEEIIKSRRRLTVLYGLPSPTVRSNYGRQLSETIFILLTTAFGDDNKIFMHIEDVPSKFSIASHRATSKWWW